MIPDIIRSLLKTRFVEFSPQHINSGLCWSFAREVQKQQPSARIMSMLLDSAVLPIHNWIEYQGINYDAEVPDGVADPADIPFIRRLNVQYVNHGAVLSYTIRPYFES